MKKTVKGFVVGFIAACLMITPLFAFADSIQVSLNTVNISLDGAQVAAKGQSYTHESGAILPYSLNYNGTVYLPIRKVSELIGKDISFDGQSATVNIGEKTADVEAPVQNAEPQDQTKPDDTAVKDTPQNTADDQKGNSSVNNEKEESGFAVISKFPKMTDSSGVQVNKLTGYLDGTACSMQTSKKDMISFSETPALYEIKYKSDVIKSIDKVSSDKEDTVAAGSTYALASNAVFYEFQKDDDGSFDGYRVISGSLKAGDKVYLYDVKGSGDYDVVIVVRQ